MSLNHLLSQVSENKTFNPRVNSLVVDGNIDAKTINGLTPITVQYGSWTPSIGDGGNSFTLSTADGKYTRIISGNGSTYYCSVRLMWTNLNGATGNVRVSIPAPISTSKNASTSCVIGYVSGVILSRQMIGVGDTISQVIFLEQLQGAGVPPVILTAAADFAASGEIQLNFSFNSDV